MASEQKNTFFKRYMAGNISTEKDKRTLNLVSLIANVIFLGLVCWCTSWIIGAVNSSDAVSVCIFSILLTGLILYGLHCGARLWYGLLEITSALFIGWFTVTHSYHVRHMTFAQFTRSPNSLSVVLGLVSSVYIVVRGLDNVAEGMKRNKEAPQTDAVEEP